jgi:molybdopterin converting factor small subunit
LNIVNELITRIKQKQQEISEAMLNGNCVNFESYQRLVGQNLGLKETLDILNNIIEEQNRDVER